MHIFQSIITYFFLCTTIYVEIFILTIFLSRQKDIKKERVDGCDALSSYPSVTIIVPCLNEEKTVGKTLESLLALDYPKDKLNIIAVDDGSTDNTWYKIERYRSRYPEIMSIKKKNGGKFTALNVGLAHSTSKFFGCLDADSFVDPKSLKKIIKRFQEQPDLMAVTPAIRIFKPHSIVQFVQTAEYYLAILIKKVQSFLGAIHVTPGPFTIFQRAVFEKIGPFKHAHNLEDMEMAFRMQKNQMRIGNVHHAWVYTTGPDSLKKLYKQRLRWTSGFLENAKDYHEMFFNPRYGNVSFFTLPVALMFIVGVFFTILFIVWRVSNFLVRVYTQWKTVGFLYPHITLNWFYLSTKIHILLSIFVLILTLFLLLNAQKLVEGHARPGRHILFFFVIYPLISPFWILKSIYNSIFLKKTSWR